MVATLIALCPVHVEEEVFCSSHMTSVQRYSTVHCLCPFQAYVFDLDDEYSESDIPTTLIRSKADCPTVEVRTGLHFKLPVFQVSSTNSAFLSLSHTHTHIHTHTFTHTRMHAHTHPHTHTPTHTHTHTHTPSPVRHPNYQRYCDQQADTDSVISASGLKGIRKEREKKRQR